MCPLLIVCRLKIDHYFLMLIGTQVRLIFFLIIIYLIYYLFLVREGQDFVYCLEVLNSRAVGDRGTEVTEKLNKFEMLLV